MNKKCFVIIILLGLLLLVACGSVSNNSESEEFVTPEITFVEPTNLARELHGTQMMAIAGVRRYQFPIYDEAYNLTLVSHFENVVYMFSDFFDTDRHMQTVMTQYAEHYAVRTVMGENLIINPDDPATYGWFVYSKVLGSIPMWLSVGMEMTARGLDFDYPIRGLSDIYFAPFSWGTTEHRQAISTAHHFVNHLIERSYLTHIVNLYMTEDWYSINLYVAEHFYLFSGYSFDTFFNLCFSGSSYALTAYTEMAVYIFEFPNFHNQIEWPDDEALQFLKNLYSVDDIDKTSLLRVITFVDDAIMFVKIWHSQFTDFDFVPIRTYIQMEFTFTASASFDVMRIPINTLSISTAHEVAHVIGAAIGDGFAFMPFEEGLAQTLQFLFNIHDKDNFGWAYQFWPLWVEAFIPYYYDIGVFESYVVADAVRNFLLKDYEHYANFQHFLAYTALNTPRLRDSPHFRRWTGGTPTEIHSYATSLSFIRYLLDTHGAESYLQVHFDESIFEYVYGVTLYAMVQEWMEFLSIAAKEFMHVAMQAQ